MMPHRISSPVRGLTWLLIFVFCLASVPAPVFAQREKPVSPGEAARERITRKSRINPAPPSAPSAPSSPREGTYDVTVETSASGTGEEYYTPNIKDATLDQLLDDYSRLTGRTMIKAPGISGTFTFQAKSALSKAEWLQAMDSLLTMNNISLVPLGTRFYRVVQMEKAPSEGMEIQKELPADVPPESDALVSQLVALEFIDIEDAMNLVQPMLHGYGKAQRFDRISSLLITDTSANLRRIFDILEMVDQPVVSQIEPKIYEIKYAKAADIAARLNELVSDSQSEDKEEVARVDTPTRRRPVSMIRARQPAAAQSAPANSAAAVEAAMAERGIITGKVKILTDERTNIIIVFSRKSNFSFFDKIVAVLDRPVDPEVIVKVIALEFADAEEMSSLLNEFIGAAQSESEVPEGAADQNATGDSRARALEDFVRARAAAADRIREAAGEAVASKIGQLSSNTKILADKRTNALMLMGTKGDVAALEEIIKKVDVMLAQVLIEAVILEVNLNNNTAYGVSWLQKSMTAYSQSSSGANGGVSVREPVASWGGNFGANSFSEVAGDTVTRALEGGSGLSYFFTFQNLNIDLLLDMVASSGEGRVLATPVILTTDNTEANIISGQQVPIRTGDTSSGGTTYSDYEYKNVGIELKVKPRINPSRYVTLEITQSADTLGDPVDVGNDSQMYTINKREMVASISVPSRSTIVLGGLVQTDYQALNTRVPILGSIPLIGALFRSEEKTRKRTELLVLITPYVLMTPEEARLETERLHHASNVAAEDWYRGWSDSSLAPFSPTKIREMKKAEQAGRNPRQMETDSRPVVIPPVAVIEPADPMPKPTPDAKDPDEFAREVERVMSGQAEAAAGDASAASLTPAGPLPEPAEPPTTAPFTIDPSAAAAPESEENVTPVPKSRRAIWGDRSSAKKKKKSASASTEPKPSMFPAPAAEEQDSTGDEP